MKHLSVKILGYIMLFGSGIFFSALSGVAQTPVSPEERYAVVDSIISRWNDWQEVTLNGKLKMAGLPVTPSVKISMQRDSSIFISIRAPFVGEVGRAEITDTTMLVVNKMKKVYIEESLEKVMSFYPGTIADLQNIFLGRVALPGLGALSHDVEADLDIYSEADSSYSLVVNEEMSIPGVNYGYVFDSTFWPVALLVLPESSPDLSVTLKYDYFENGYDLSFFYRSDKKILQATLEFNLPVWSAKPLDRISLGSKYRKVELKDFLKSSGL